MFEVLDVALLPSLCPFLWLPLRVLIDMFSSWPIYIWFWDHRSWPNIMKRDGHTHPQCNPSSKRRIHCFSHVMWTSRLSWSSLLCWNDFESTSSGSYAIFRYSPTSLLGPQVCLKQTNRVGPNTLSPQFLSCWCISIPRSILTIRFAFKDSCAFILDTFISYWSPQLSLKNI